ncbi:hypothetical protein KFL_000400040 [Klebsormidium nitens]|uniref:MYND-type domain-containing protein n=1 Tax=Klebsormidium nitens TaxID=105231 RepID=A0A1Y1HS97_KLENI|nr:hypothetical protein KFL_000400040 [Klebsormidium nitens]|eukprot:GAQ79861.1 hypothetical protein KFL_000400040 [Klebsormidium nitens]
MATRRANIRDMSAREVASLLQSKDYPTLAQVVQQLTFLAAGNLRKGQAPEDVIPSQARRVQPEEERDDSRTAASYLLSEIAALNGGAVIKQLLKQFLEVDEREIVRGAVNGDSLAFQSGMALGPLSSHKPVARLILQHCNVEKLVDRFVVCLEQSCKPGIEGPGTYLPLVLIAFPALAHMVRASRELRAEMRKHDEIFKALHEVLSERILKTQRPDNQNALRGRLSEFLNNVATCKDLETWLIGQGYVEAIARIFATSQGRPFDLATQIVGDQATMRCFMGFTQMLENQEVCRLVRERRGIEILTPVSGTIRGIGPGIWETMQAQIRGFGARQYTPEERKETRKVANHDLSTPKVCAYPGCGAKEDPFLKITLMVCGRCHMAYYCGKEHQRLHWKEHKKVCT